jgi:hypothetical protein
LQQVKELHGQIANLELRLLSSGRAAKETADRLRADLETAQAAVAAAKEKRKAGAASTDLKVTVAKCEALQRELEKLRKENKSLREAAQDWGIKEKRLDLDKEAAELRISRLEEKVRAFEEGAE